MNQTLNFVILSDDPDTIRELRRAIAEDGRARVLASSDSVEGVYADIVRLRPSAAVISLDAEHESRLALIKRLAATSPETVIICAARDSSPDLILRSLRAGAREFLRLPVIVEELSTVLDGTAEVCAAQAATSKKRGRVIAVFSSKGGCGTSFLATNVAAILQAPTVLIDLNLQAGDLDLFLGMESKYSIVDLVENRTRLDDSLLNSYLKSHSPTLSLLASPREAGAAEHLNPEHIIQAIDVLRERFSFVVIDEPHTLDANTVATLDHADEVLLVLTLDIPAIRSAQRTLAIFDQLGYTREKVRIVVNRMSKQADLDLPQVERYLGERVAEVVHNDYRQVINSINLGQPVVESQPSSMIAGDFKRLVAAIPGAVVPHSPAQPRKGLFGSVFRRQPAAPPNLALRVSPDKA